MGDDGVEIGMTGSEGTRPAKGWKGAARDSGMHPLWAPSSGLGREGGTGEASHGERVGHAALALARALGLRERDAVLIGDAARFHDVGKLALSGKILRKPGRLTSAEFEAVKTHPLHGWTLLRQRHGAHFELAAQIALHHHENWDGTGYPLGLAGENIPLPARIVSVVDVFDALVHARCYKDAWPASRALTLIASAGGRVRPARRPRLSLPAPPAPPGVGRYARMVRIRPPRRGILLSPTARSAGTPAVSGGGPGPRSCGSPHTGVLIEDTGHLV